MVGVRVVDWVEHGLGGRGSGYGLFGAAQSGQGGNTANRLAARQFQVSFILNTGLPLVEDVGVISRDFQLSGRNFG